MTTCRQAGRPPTPCSLLPNNMRRLLPLLLILPLLGLSCTKGVSQAVREASRPVTLKYWRVIDDAAAFDEIIRAYRAIHPHVTIEYRKFRLEEYEDELLNALAEDRGPDIFTIHNTWMRGYQPKLLPLPSSLTLPFQEVRGTIKKETVTTIKQVPTLSIRKVQTDFVEQVGKDVILETTNEKRETVSQIWGLPLFMDSLALFYNRDLSSAAGIAEPPGTWSDFQAATKKLSRVDAQNKVLQAGAALGTARNVEQAFDILSLIMMQNRTQMADESGNATFHLIPRELAGRQTPPGEEALVFYTDFASPSKDVYTWNTSQPNSLEAFATGKAAMMLGYSYNIPQIRARAPKLNFAVAPAPQIAPGDQINYANYWLEVVSKKTERPNEAWDFIQFASSAEQVKKYLDVTKKPTALRALRAGQLEDLDIGVFANQILTAKSWYKGVDIAAAEEAFEEMIESVVVGAIPKQAISIAVGKVNQTIE